MKKIIKQFQSIPGEHCGSAAMRNLLSYYCGLELREGPVFGLGSGIDFFIIHADGTVPMLSGRSASLEADAAMHLGIDYQEHFETDNRQAWEAVREEVINDRPVMLTGDIFYLDYREFKVHFPAHRFVLVGFDDERQEAYIMDRIKPESETCSYSALAESRNPSKSISTFNLWGRFGDVADVRPDLEKACRAALKTCAGRMMGLQQNTSLLMQGLNFQFKLKTGVAALEELPDKLLQWQHEPFAAKAAVFNADCIEKFGTGGGMFRNLYADFLQYVHEEFPGILDGSEAGMCRSSAKTWTELSQALSLAAAEENSSRHWEHSSEIASRIAGIERELFGSILNRL